MVNMKRLLSIPVTTPVAPSIARPTSLKAIPNIVVPLSFLLASVIAPLHASEVDVAVAIKPGQALYESACVVCHQPMKAGQKHGGGHGDGKGGGAHGAKEGHANRLAPPMMMVKKHYLMAYPEKQVFVQKVADWVAAPDQNSARLSHAVERFGLMPPQAIDEASREQIAEYIFDTLPLPEGGKHGGGKHGSGESGCHGDKGKGHGGGKGGGKGTGEKNRASDASDS
ncbi:MAG: hypothetical protein KUG71_05555 [Porticoccaceae bacterium]|nr:hypothetical protein [Porticoccaceae bacterium]